MRFCGESSGSASARLMVPRMSLAPHVPPRATATVGAWLGGSSSVMVSTAVLWPPRVAPPVGLLSVRFTETNRQLPPTTTIMSLTEGGFGGPGRVFGQLLQRRPGGLFGHLCALAGTALSDTDPLKGRLAVSAISQIGMDDTRAAAIT